MVRQFLRLTLMEFRIFLREPMAVFFNLFFPLMFLFLVMEVFVPKPYRGVAAINVYLPCFFVIIITSVSLFNVPIYIVKYRSQKFLKRLRVAPVRPLTILFSLGLANLFMMILGLVLVTVVGVVVYGASITSNLWVFIPALILTFTALASVGLLIASFCRGMRTVNIIGQIIYYPMIFLSGGILIPLPEGMGTIQYAVPASYGVNLVQHVWGTDFDSRWGQLLPRTGGPVVDVIVLSVMTVICLVIAARTFKWE